jgi:hypothetical protein
MKLSCALKKALLGVARGHGPYFGCVGRSEFGGRDHVSRALQRRGSLRLTGSKFEITDAGVDAMIAVKADD